jgi:hypothetical protein
VWLQVLQSQNAASKRSLLLVLSGEEGIVMCSHCCYCPIHQGTFQTKWRTLSWKQNGGGSDTHFGERTVDDSSHDAYSGTGHSPWGNCHPASKGSAAFMRSLQALAWDLQRKGLELKGYSMEPLVPAGTLTELSKLRLQHCIHRSSSSVSPLVDVQYHVALP